MLLDKIHLITFLARIKPVKCILITFIMKRNPLTLNTLGLCYEEF